MPLVTLVPSVDEPEELGGIPLRHGRTVEYSVPPAVTSAYRKAGVSLDTPAVILIDELDKARPDTLGALLKLLSWERTLRSWAPAPGSALLVAMNMPEEPLPDPLVQRLIFIPFPAAIDDWAETLPPVCRAIDLKRLPRYELTYPPRPLNCPQPLIDQWLSFDLLWANQNVRELLVRGMYPAEHVPSVLDWMRTELTLHQPVADWARTVTPPRLLDTLPRRWRRAIAEEGVSALVTAMQILADRANADPTGEMAMAYDAIFACPEAALLNIQTRPEEADAAIVTAAKAKYAEMAATATVKGAKQ